MGMNSSSVLQSIALVAPQTEYPGVIKPGTKHRDGGFGPRSESGFVSDGSIKKTKAGAKAHDIAERSRHLDIVDMQYRKSRDIGLTAQVS
jgi:hypothetical protein